ncbi:hypothetical protein Godav_029633 [Gossypium davidsonii]|uniref:3'-5' exonuclease domain-containing protein n=1 Tax=Gossypium davidsonii TaxID=34287 RepID=A0A7J8TIR7_GOSDV|nr:hypothetical protein [Gossypium davidsonii]
MDFVDKNMKNLEPIKPPSIEYTPFKLVEEVKDLELAAKLCNVDDFAIDLEHNQYRSFQGLTCLMQISTRTKGFIVDTLILRIHIGHYFREIFKNPMKREVMHRENRDILWLQRDFGIHLCDLLDTGQASRVLKLERNNLKHILQHYFRVTVGYLDGAFDVELLVENLLGQPVGNQGSCGGLHFYVTESHTTTFVGEDKVVIFGGSGEGEIVSLNDFHVLDHRTMRWTSPTMRVHIPIPKDSDSAIAIGNKLVVTRLQYLAVEHKRMEAGPIHNLLGVEVCGKVDGAFNLGCKTPNPSPSPD